MEVPCDWTSYRLKFKINTKVQFLKNYIIFHEFSPLSHSEPTSQINFFCFPFFTSFFFLCFARTSENVKSIKNISIVQRIFPRIFMFFSEETGYMGKQKKPSVLRFSRSGKLKILHAIKWEFSQFTDVTRKKLKGSVPKNRMNDGNQNVTRWKFVITNFFSNWRYLFGTTCKKVAANKVARINLFRDKRKLLITGTQAVSFRIPQPYLSLDWKSVFI